MVTLNLLSFDDKFFALEASLSEPIMEVGNATPRLSCVLAVCFDFFAQ